MKRLLLLCLTYIMCVGNHQMAAQDSSESPGIFNSLAVGVSASTTGIGIDVASPIGSYLAVRAGVSFMPNFTYSTDVDVDIEGSYEGNIPTSIDVEGGMGRTAGEILLNVYPFKSSSFFVCGGAYFGGGKLIKIKGHSDELAELTKEEERQLAGFVKGKAYGREIPPQGNDSESHALMDENYEELWRTFCASIAISQRKNPLCQRTHLPLRYRPYMTEFTTI